MVIKLFRSIISVCGLWDVSLIDFELNRNSVLKYLVEYVVIIVVIIVIIVIIVVIIFFILNCYYSCFYFPQAVTTTH